ncbi:17453_t:CDS:2 [Funneliformis caledonium]|uniref:17453_t:CDS:1 n=1 Tax=Funneliformis caledonium TaxID=1117310 RepID=A0A9N9B9F2_9GLOM|nr:17453_t:CDS:2 [Funneliformis caledonium]
MSLTMTKSANTSTSSTSSSIRPANSIGTLIPTTSPGNNNISSPQQKLSSPSTMSLRPQQPPIVTSVPPEIFAKICDYLTPIDIFKLSTVCLQYRNFLCTPCSVISQNIWRNSRTKFLTYPELPPPQGMEEEKYIRITNFDKSCEFCGNRDPESSRLYWEFRLEKSADIQIEIIETLPCVWIRGGAFAVPVHRYYWIDDVKSISKEYSSLKGKDYSSWLLKKKEQHKKYMAEVSRYYLEDQKQWNDLQKKSRHR